MRSWQRPQTHLHHACVAAPPAFISVQEHNVAFSPQISVIMAETACNCQRFSKVIRRDKLWITVIITLDRCHWTATAGRCFHRLFADTVSQCLRVYWVVSAASGNKRGLLGVCRQTDNGFGETSKPGVKAAGDDAESRRRREKIRLWEITRERQSRHVWTVLPTQQTVVSTCNLASLTWNYEESALGYECRPAMVLKYKYK